MRRYLLAIFILLACVACGGRNPSPTATLTSAPPVLGAQSTPTPPATSRPEPTPTPTEPPGTELRYKWQRGDKFEQAWKLNGNTVVLSAPDQKIAMELDLEFLTTVTTVKGATGMLELRYKKVGGMINGEPLIEGSGEEQENQFAQLTRTLEVDELGKARQVKNPSQEDSPLPGGGLTTYDTFFLFPSLPAEPVAPGDTWTSEQGGGQGPDTTAGRSKSTFKEWVERDGKQLARIRSEITVEADEIRGGQNATTQIQQTYLFDAEAGQVVSSDGTMTVEGEAGDVGKIKSDYTFDIQVKKQ